MGKLYVLMRERGGPVLVAATVGSGSHPIPSVSESELHDRAVDALLAEETRHAAYANAHGHRNCCVTVRRREFYPDVVLCDRETFRIEHVVEVETDASLTVEQARLWALEARGPWKLWLLVQEPGLAHARALCARLGIRATIVPWSVSAARVEVHWPAPLLQRR